MSCRKSSVRLSQLNDAVHYVIDDLRLSTIGKLLSGETHVPWSDLTDSDAAEASGLLFFLGRKVLIKRKLSLAVGTLCGHEAFRYRLEQ